MILPVLFHWSPVERRDAIRKEGLRPGCDPTVASGKLLADATPKELAARAPSGRLHDVFREITTGRKVAA